MGATPNPTQAPRPDPEIAGQAAGGTEQDSRLRSRRVLVFMNVSTPDLVEPARAAKTALESALKSYFDHNRTPDDQQTKVRVLVHGYQLQDQTEIDSVVYRYDCDGGGLTISWRPDQCAPYLPGDPQALFRFARQGFNEPAFGPWRCMLVLWGHGQGVAGRLTPSLDALGGGPRALPPRVDRPSLLNFGELPDQTIADGLEKELARQEKEPGKSPHGCLTQTAEQRALRPPRFDIVVFDSCLMATIEQAYQYREVADYLIASQTFVGRPGLNLGAAVVEYLKVRIDEPGLEVAEYQAKSAPSRQGTPISSLTKPAVIDAAKNIVNLAGDLKSGADQLTLLRLTGIPEGAAQRHSGLARHGHGFLRSAVERVRTDECGSLANFDAMSVLTPLVDFPSGRAPRGQEDFAPEAFERRPWLGLLWAFAHLLRSATGDRRENPRILAAFQRTRYLRVRQFLDLRDLARQVHLYSRFVPLQLVALELVRELQQNDDGPVVLWRALVSDKQRERMGGVSVYCPWFEARGYEEVDAVVDHAAYEALDLNTTTCWSGFVLGPTYAQTRLATSARRRRRRRELAERLELLRLVRAACRGPWVDPDGVVIMDPKTAGMADVDPKTSGMADLDPKTSGLADLDPKTSGLGEM